MNEVKTSQKIDQVLKDFQHGTLINNARNLLNTLGYDSEMKIDLESNLAEDFISEFDPSRKLNRERAMVEEWETIDLLFQLTEKEIFDSETSEKDDSSNRKIDNTIIESYLFFAVKLRENNCYSRTQLSNITREINKPMPMPAMIIFQHGQTLTFAVIDRRLHKRDESEDVLEKVTLIKDINFKNPHRAHIQILFDFSRNELSRVYDFSNFVELHRAWAKTLDTEELNKKFYRKMFAWFEWAIDEAKFPTDEKRVIKPEEHVIRLITRLLFIWFIKEKGLVAEELFNKAQIQNLLKADDFDNGDSYYRAVLQNLFFATLNTEIDKREFSKENYSGNRDFSRYRYKTQMRDPDKLLEFFAKTPFINGGLFDCLDSFKAPTSGGYRIDCFSDVDYKKLSIPNHLFFDENQGLLPTILEHYKFTVEENTPIEQEVALDPELLGRVFEHLLAAINPETGATVRKQTGSYYTPRAIVDYMVEEALVAVLSQKCQPTDTNEVPWDERLHYLFDYAKVCDDASVWFDDRETDAIVKTISELKILDPAVGSGAFPMGVLHKLTLALRRLDPDNNRWEALQKELAAKRAADAFDTQDDQARREELHEIDDTFKRYRDSDFGRKLYLIQNSIFGVDIQPIACQIAKLRFFISLAIEQQPNDNPNENFGIKPLPNLETRFVAANTLIGIDLSEARGLFQDDIVQQLLKEIDGIREKFFFANNRGTKRKLEEQEKKCRKQLENELERQRTEWIENRQREIERKIASLRNSEQRKQVREKEQKTFEARKKVFDADFENARKIVRWKPYDQNAKADWFDPEWMFRLTDRFDVVIGNPPYVESRNSLLTDEQKTAYGKQVVSDWEESLPRGSDLLIYFYARSAKFLNEFGNGCFITQNAWLNTDYGHKFQRFSVNKFSFLQIVDTSAKFFSDTKSQNINAIITLFSRKIMENMEYGIADASMAIANKKMVKSDQLVKWGHIFSMPEYYGEILSKIRTKSKIISNISFGQGLNVPLSQLSDDNSDLPIIVKSAQFVALSADKRIKPALASKREDKIPALIMPRGVGARHYCTFNAEMAFSYSHVELYLPEELWNSDIHYCLWVYLNSSFVWLFREITGRKNLGGGLLKAEATDMKMLPIDFNFDFAHEAKQVYEMLKDRKPMPVAEEIYTDGHLFIDDIIASYFGFHDRLEDIRNTLIEQVNFRLSRAKSQK